MIYAVFWRVNFCLDFSHFFGIQILRPQNALAHKGIVSRWLGRAQVGLDYQILTLRKVCAAWPRTSICQCARPSISHYDHSSIFSQLPPQYFSRWPSYFSQRPHNYLSQVSVLCISHYGQLRKLKGPSTELCHLSS